MANIKLTPARIAAFTCPEGKSQAFLRDAEQPGLGLRVTPSGTKAYIFQGKLAGQVIRMTLDDAQALTLSEARDKAAALRIQIREGRDPRVAKAEITAADIAKRKKTKQAKTPALEAWQAYIKARASKWSERHKADHETMSREGGQEIKRGRREGMPEKKEPGILLPLLGLPLSDITRDAVADWLEQQGHRPTRARLALSLLGTFLNWCSDRPEYRNEVNPDACIRMKKDLPKPQAKDDCLQREQVKLWFDHVQRISNPIQSAYLQCLLLTGARRNEMAALRWDDLDLKWNTLRIRDKVEGERTIPLTPHVKRLIEGLKPARVVALRDDDVPEPSPFVFASATSASGHITEPRIAHNQALRIAGLPALSLHGLRRSFGTLAEWVECPTGVVAQIMGHKPTAIAEKHYRRRPIDLLRVWHEKIERWILEQAGIDQPTEEPLTNGAIAA